LVWKIYQRATGIELGELKKMKDFDVSNRIVKEILHKRYKDEIPWEEPVISPVGIFECSELEVVR
jgi:hypothetical protein